MFEYEALITRVIDGDTYKFEIDLGFGITYRNTMRLYGCDTPEIKGEEREEGLKVKEYVKKLIEGKKVKVKTYKFQEKYGRYLADLFPFEYGSPNDMESLSEHLLKKGYALRMNYD